VLCGDFLQLPPVDKSGDNTQEISSCYESDVWPLLQLHICYLRVCFRQAESAFAALLNEVRMGMLSREHEEELRTVSRAPKVGAPAVQLRPTHNEVDDINNRHFHRLDGCVYRYDAHDYDPAKCMDLRTCIAPDTVKLRVNTKVMLLRNQPCGTLVNGSVGIVVGFRSVHNECAISEPDAIVNLHLIQPHPEEFRDGGPWFPMVRFDGRDELTMVEPAAWEVIEYGRTVAKRIQIPLMQAWAVTIHKAQGMSLDRVDIDMNRMFENGQAYVALSRVRTIEGLWLHNFRPDNIHTCERALSFFSCMEEYLSSAEGADANKELELRFGHLGGELLPGNPHNT
jgi:ATP-dependent DNA helicase PIF1